MKRIIIVALISMFLSGCGTFLSRDPFFKNEGVYPATRFDAEMIKESESPYPVFFAMDIPVSFVTDTLLIPYDLLR
ncbi:YceK/YidQ family lipoprotein [uncultured Cedecea sp.]|uniref:YceK/YidQ family lipoprotein n=1 Tax=uncultured Cedecea sp. TaxID=988762 RepID=UPI002620C3C8|nr:YceK/YidQ family lipoprotein [uncultured Cedecea sp.]